MMTQKLMPYLGVAVEQLGRYLASPTSKAWFTAAIDGEWDDDLDDDIIEKMWRARCKG